jgi:hypothetical protein
MPIAALMSAITIESLGSNLNITCDIPEQGCQLVNGVKLGAANRIFARDEALAYNSDFNCYINYIFLKTSSNSHS